MISSTIEGFKRLFGEIAVKSGFQSAFGGWFKESSECIFVLDLQKSNFGDYYDLNIKLFIQGVFDKVYVKNKDLVKKEVGDIFRRQPNDFNDVFKLDNSMNDIERRTKLEKLFLYFIIPFSNNVLTRAGIKELAEKSELFILPAIKKELNIN